MSQSVTISNAVQFGWAVGDTVGAYPVSNWLQSQLPPSGSPTGSATTTAVVAADGSLAFTNLADGVAYYAAKNTSTTRYVQFAAESLSGTPAHTNVLGAAFSPAIISPYRQIVLSGSFTARATKAFVDLAGAVILTGPGGFQANLEMYWGDNAVIPAGQMTPVHQGDALGTGVNHERLGSVQGGFRAPTPGKGVVLSSLTLERVYRYEITAGVAGYAAALPTGGAAYRVAVSSKLTPYPDASWYSACLNGTNVTIFRHDNFADKYADYTLGSIAVTGTGTGDVAITADGTKAVSANQSTGQATVINTLAPTTSAQSAPPSAAPTKQGDYTMPTTGGVRGSGTPQPQVVAISADGLTAYFGIGAGVNVGCVLPMTISTGVFGTPIDLALASATFNALKLSADGRYLYFSSSGGVSGSSVVGRIDLQSSNAVAVLKNDFGSSVGINDIAVKPDGTAVVAVSHGTGNIWKLNAATGAILDGPITSGAPEAVEYMPDGRAFVFVTDATSGNQVRQVNDVTGLPIYVTWVNRLGTLSGNNYPAYDIAIDPYGAMYVGGYSQHALNRWFGGIINWSPSDDFNLAELRLRVIGAD